MECVAFVCVPMQQPRKSAHMDATGQHIVTVVMVDAADRMATVHNSEDSSRRATLRDVRVAELYCEYHGDAEPDDPRHRAVCRFSHRGCKRDCKCGFGAVVICEPCGRLAGDENGDTRSEAVAVALLYYGSF